MAYYQVAVRFRTVTDEPSVVRFLLNVPGGSSVLKKLDNALKKRDIDDTMVFDVRISVAPDLEDV
jgi:hypothetical protein